MKRLLVVLTIMFAVLVTNGALVYAQGTGTGAGAESTSDAPVVSQAASATVAQSPNTTGSQPADTAAPQMVRLEGAQLPETYAELKTLYLSALERIAELEAAIQEALDLARGYRSDWAEQRAVAEARKAQTDQALGLASTLTAMIKEMKDIINKQHEIIMKLTATKPLSVGFSAGVSLQRMPTATGGFAFQPGVTLGVIVFP